MIPPAAAPRVDRPHRILLLDLDGTAYLGDLPVQAYARHVAEGLPPDAGRALIAAVRAFLERRSDIPGDPGLNLSTARDGHHAVELAAAALGADPAAVDAAYHASRLGLAGSAFALDPVPGLAETLAAAGDRCLRVLATNADPAGVAAVLAAVELTPVIDRVVVDVGKPAGLAGLITELLAETGLTGADLLAVGDVWESDLAPVAAAGGATALVDRFGRGVGTPTWRAPNLAELLPEIRSWLAAGTTPSPDRSRPTPGSPARQDRP